MKRRLSFILSLYLTTSVIFANTAPHFLAKKQRAATKGCYDMSLAISSWQQAEISENPFVIYDLKNNPTLYIFTVNNDDGYLGYVAVNHHEDRPLYQEVSTTICPRDQYQNNMDKIHHLLGINTKESEEISFIYVDFNYFVTIKSNPIKYVNIHDFSINSFETLNDIDEQYFERIQADKNYFESKWNILSGTEIFESGKSLTSTTNILDGVPNYEWYRGCWPTAMAMTFNYHGAQPGFEGLYHPATTFTWQGPETNEVYVSKELADMFADYYGLCNILCSSSSYGVEPEEQPASVSSVANSLGYIFDSDIHTDPGEEAQLICHEIDNGRPFKFGGVGHAQLGYGYTDSGDNIYTYTTLGGSGITSRTSGQLLNIVTAIPHLIVPDNVPTIQQALDYIATDENVYVRSMTLTEDVTVPDGRQLVIMNGETIDLNGHFIRCEGSGKIVNSGTVVGYDLFAQTGSDYKGFCPFSASFSDWASSEWDNIYVTIDIHNLGSNVTVPNDVVLTVPTGAYITLGQFFINCEGTGSIDNNGQIFPDNYLAFTGTNCSGFYPSIESAISNAKQGQTVRLPESTTLTSDWTAADGIEIDVPAGMTLTMGIFSITTSSGVFTIAPGSDINPNIQAKEEVSPYGIKGLYPTIQQALDETSDLQVFPEAGDYESDFLAIGNTDHLILDNNTTLSISENNYIIVSGDFDVNDGCYIKRNTTGDRWAGIVVTSGGALTMTNSQITEYNSVGITVEAGGNAYLENCWAVQGSTTRAIKVVGGTAEIVDGGYSNSQINISASSGAVLILNGVLTSSPYNNANVYANNSSVTIQDPNIQFGKYGIWLDYCNNSADVYGGTVAGTEISLIAKFCSYLDVDGTYLGGGSFACFYSFQNVFTKLRHCNIVRNGSYSIHNTGIHAAYTVDARWNHWFNMLNGGTGCVDASNPIKAFNPADSESELIEKGNNEHEEGNDLEALQTFKDLIVNHSETYDAGKAFRYITHIFTGRNVKNDTLPVSIEVRREKYKTRKKSLKANTQAALSYYGEIKKLIKQKDVDDYIKEELDNQLLFWYLRDQKNNEVEALMDRMLAEYPSQESQIGINVKKAFYYLDFKHDRQKAIRLIEKLQKKYKDEATQEHLNRILSMMTGSEIPYDKPVEKTTEIVEQNSLLDNFPNPFNPSTTIPFTLKNVAHVSIQVFDITGRQINVLANTIYQPGRHEVIFNGTNLPSGLYFIKAQIAVEESKEVLYFTRKITMLK